MDILVGFSEVTLESFKDVSAELNCFPDEEWARKNAEAIIPMRFQDYELFAIIEQV